MWAPDESTRALRRLRATGPLRAFFERVRARKGPQVAATATARDLPCLLWCLLTGEQDYAFR